MAASRLGGQRRHEFNNLIGGIHGFAQWRRFREAGDNQKSSSGDPSSKRARKIADGLLRMLSVRNPDGSHRSRQPGGSGVALVERSFRKYNITIDQAIEELFLIRSNNHGLQQVLLHSDERCAGWKRRGDPHPGRAEVTAVFGLAWRIKARRFGEVTDAFVPDQAMLDPRRSETTVSADWV
jgi:hypothetical protein